MSQYTGTSARGVDLRTVGAAAGALLATFDGAVHLPGSAGYDAQRTSLIPMVDARPALVVEASRAADVRAAVNVARAHDLPFAVQATGHGTRVPADGGILLRTSAMATVLVDPDRRVARVGPGARWSEVLAAATPFGLAPVSGSAPSVGVTGYTLGGGLGWLSRRFGFAADSVLRAQVVTADGRLLTVDADRHADLFWALRGGGGNFGVVTGLEFRLHPVATVYAGVAYFSAFSGSRAADTLASYRDWAAGMPDEMSTAVLLTTLPDSDERTLAIKVMYAGAAEDARTLLRPLWAAAGPVRLDGLRTTPFTDAAMGGTPARYLDMFRELPDAAIGSLVRAGQRATIEVRHWGGAMGRPGPGAGPVGHRGTTFSVIMDAPDADDAVRAFGTGGTFLNFLADPARVATAYAPDDYRRLREVKRAYDPDNFFRINHNIPPADVRAE